MIALEDEIAEAFSLVDIDEIDPSDEESVRRFVLSQIKHSGCTTEYTENLDLKGQIRASHAQQKIERGRKELAAIGHRVPKLLDHFANGSDIDLDRISPTIETVTSDTQSADLFRICALIWSVPVSKGYGRRMRYLVRDASNNKIIGIFALGDPVFNLRTRDEWIGWNVAQRRERLASVMDAYIVGAVPPYSMLLGGKLVSSLIGSNEVREDFRIKYQGKAGLISERVKPAELALVTVTSALGRSSIYNRLKLPDVVDFKPIGFTEGWGHFQFNDSTFELLRKYLESKEHPYANGHQFGQGPNWKLRTIRQALDSLRIDSEILRHGIKRQVYALPLCENVGAYLQGTSEYMPVNVGVEKIAEAALNRWVRPRASRMPGFRDWNKAEFGLQVFSTISKQLPLALNP